MPSDLHADCACARQCAACTALGGVSRCAHAYKGVRSMHTSMRTSFGLLTATGSRSGQHPQIPARTRDAALS
jgi:hypothetical protein